MKKIQGLNTLRFLAFLSVFLYHTLSGFKYGFYGVDFFFVLSSFLLTFLALKEIKKSGRFSKRNFFIRRALRIFPLYFLIVGFSFIVLPFILKNEIQLPENEFLYWILLSNYDYSNSIFALKFLWSISVEEQFYLLFILFSFLLKKNIYLFSILLLSIYCVFFSFANQYNIPTDAHTITHFPNFAIGIFSAHLYFKNVKLKFYPLLVLVISLLGVIILKNELLNNILISFIFASLIFITISFYQIFDYQRNIVLKTIENLGKYSYGLYIYSGFVITFVLKYTEINNEYIRILVELPVLFLLSFISYHLFEKKFLSLKEKFRKQKISTLI